jgi:hypothetical protein
MQTKINYKNHFKTNKILKNKIKKNPIERKKN